MQMETGDSFPTITADLWISYISYTPRKTKTTESPKRNEDETDSSGHITLLLISRELSENLGRSRDQ